MFGINPGEFAVLLLVALIVVGPERLPRYAQQLGRMVREGRRMAMGLREQVRGELGPEFDEVDWKKLDPRQYDPRKIIRDALTDTIEDEPETTKPVSAGGPKPAGSRPSVSPAAKRPGSAASPLAAAAAGGGSRAAAAAGPSAGAAAAPDDAGTGTGTGTGAASGTGPAPGAGAAEGTDGDEQPSEHAGVPQARTATGAPVDLEAT